MRCGSGRATSPLFEGSSRARTSTKLPRLVVKGAKGFVNEPLPLGVSINDASGGERVILAGFAIGTKLSAGTPLGLTSWQMLARDVGNAFVYAPKDFVGIMVAAIDLRSPSDCSWTAKLFDLNGFPPPAKRRGGEMAGAGASRVLSRSDSGRISDGG